LALLMGCHFDFDCGSVCFCFLSLSFFRSEFGSGVKTGWYIFFSGVLLRQGLLVGGRYWVQVWILNLHGIGAWLLDYVRSLLRNMWFFFFFLRLVGNSAETAVIF
jgi:hypothetical protein